MGEIQHRVNQRCATYIRSGSFSNSFWVKGTTLIVMHFVPCALILSYMVPASDQLLVCYKHCQLMQNWVILWIYSLTIVVSIQEYN